jgi:hypothetical protein
MTTPVTVLFARKDSHYKGMRGVRVYDENRDARTFPGGTPVVAHPPCAQWGRLRAFARPDALKKNLAVLAAATVRTEGGVLEHPYGSTLWKTCELPMPGVIDEWGGFTTCVLQQWWGHRAAKPTWLYICGIKPAQLPPIPFVIGEASHVVSASGMKRFKRPELGTRERELTPPAFARWLIRVARLCADRSIDERPANPLPSSLNFRLTDSEAAMLQIAKMRRRYVAGLCNTLQLGSDLTKSPRTQTWSKSEGQAKL